MKRIAAILCAVLILFSSVPLAYAGNGSTTVYITNTGECYHTGSCSYLRQSKIAVTLEYAVDHGYRACSRCHPPALSRTQQSTQAPTSSYTAPSYTEPSRSYSSPSYSYTPSTSTSSTSQMYRSSDSSSSSNPLYTVAGIAGVGVVGYLIGQRKRNK